MPSTHAPITSMAKRVMVRAMPSAAIIAVTPPSAEPNEARLPVTRLATISGIAGACCFITTPSGEMFTRLRLRAALTVAMAVTANTTAMSPQAGSMTAAAPSAEPLNGMRPMSGVAERDERDPHQHQRDHRACLVQTCELVAVRPEALGAAEHDGEQRGHARESGGRQQNRSHALPARTGEQREDAKNHRAAPF